jgi:hypothetical protein
VSCGERLSTCVHARPRCLELSASLDLTSSLQGNRSIVIGECYFGVSNEYLFAYKFAKCFKVAIFLSLLSGREFSHLLPESSIRVAAMVHDVTSC